MNEVNGGNLKVDGPSDVIAEVSVSICLHDASKVDFSDGEPRPYHCFRRGNGADIGGFGVDEVVVEADDDDDDDDDASESGERFVNQSDRILFVR